MKLFDFNKIKGLPYEEMHKNVLYKTGEFKIRVIDLPENGFPSVKTPADAQTKTCC